ncbi:GNBP3 [Trypoxylus dichotomus]
MLKWTLYLLYFVSYSKANLCGQYRIPKPTFTVYNPQGLEVSIPDENGINLVIFYISVNKGLSESEADYTEYVVNQVNGRWTFSKDTIKLAVGDIVYHKIYVQRYRRGYLYRGTPYVVTGRERVNWPKPVRPGHKPDDDCYEFPTTVPLPPTPSTTEASISNKVSTTELPTLNGATPLDCSLFSNTLLKILANTQQELDNLKNNQETILEMASVQPYNLRLSGLVTALGLYPKTGIMFISPSLTDLRQVLMGHGGTQPHRIPRESIKSLSADSTLRPSQKLNRSFFEKTFASEDPMLKITIIQKTCGTTKHRTVTESLRKL